jgi:hypothetical protein
MEFAGVAHLYKTPVYMNCMFGIILLIVMFLFHPMNEFSILTYLIRKNRTGILKKQRKPRQQIGETTYYIHTMFICKMVHKQFDSFALLASQNEISDNSQKD